MNRDMKEMREDYLQGTLDIEIMGDHPLEQFNLWFDQAKESQEKEPNAMILSTISQDGYPDTRTVLLKEIIDGQMVFYTNYKSAKGQQLANNPKCHLLFLWLNLERQVRIKGTATKLSKDKSFDYFKSRPRGSKIGAWSSPQSDIIDNRNLLEQKVKETEQKFEGIKDIPLPDFWGGYAVQLTEVEFWQGRSSRLHDRIRYRLVDGNWKVERLAP